MEENKSTSLQKHGLEHREVTEPERQYGGPQSGLPPPFIVGSDVAPYLVVGIDFGTWNCRLSSYANNEVYSLEPHSVSNTVESVLGAELRSDKKGHSLKRCLADSSLVKFDHEIHSASAVTTTLFHKIKGQVQKSTQRLLAKTVITVPACFNYFQRKALKDAAQEAGLEVLALLNEATAASLDACFQNDLRTGKYLVISAGSFTCDLQVIHVQNKLLEMKTITSRPGLSGDSISHALLERLKLIDYSSSEQKLAIETAKSDLSDRVSATVRISGRTETFTRNQLEELLADEATTFEAAVNEILKCAQVQRTEISAIIFSGKGSKLWIFDKILKRIFGMHQSLEGAAYRGAGLYAAILTKQVKDWIVWDALALPVMVAHGTSVREIISAHSPVPITGHARLAPDSDGITRAIVMQKDLFTEDLANVATLSIEEKLPPSSTDSNVDIAIGVTADGLLSFSARDISLDINLTVLEEAPAKSSVVVELIHTRPGRVLRDEHPSKNQMELFESGLLLSLDLKDRYVDYVRHNSSAAQNRIQVYDQLISINGIASNDPRLLEYWKKEPGDVNELVLSRRGYLYRASLAVPVQSSKSFRDRIREAIIQANVADDEEALMWAIYDYGVNLLAAAPSVLKLEETLEMTFNRCARLARKQKAHVLLLDCLCSKLTGRLQLFEYPNISELELYDSVEEIISLLKSGDFSYPPAAAKLAIELAFKLKELDDSHFNMTVQSLLQSALGICAGYCREQFVYILPATVFRRVLDYIGAPLPDDFELPRLWANPAESEQSNQTFAYPSFALISNDDLLRLTPNTVDEFLTFPAGDFVSAETLQRDFPYQAAMSYQELGKWWLAYEASNARPNETDLLIMKQRCSSYIAWCDNSTKAFEQASIILLGLLGNAQIESSEAKHAKYLAAIIPIMAGLNRTSEALSFTRQLRRLLRQGAKLVHSTVTEVCQMLVAAELFIPALEYCEKQRQGLDLTNPINITDNTNVLWNLAKIHAAQGDKVGCVAAYLLLIDDARAKPFVQLRFQIELAQFLALVGHADYESEIDKAERLALKLRAIDSSEVTVWRARLFKTTT